MPEHLRALVVILGCSALVFKFFERPLAPLMLPGTYQRRRNLWLAIVCAAFLSHNFWLYVLACSLILLSPLGRDKSPLSVYCLLLIAVPAFEAPVPGFGLMEHIFAMHHVRLLNLLLLLPLAMKLAGASEPKPTHARAPDFAMLAFLLLTFALHARLGSVTGSMRFMFYLAVDVWLPYFVASRALRDVKSFQDVASAFVLGVAVICPIAVVEMLRGWLLYDGLRIALDLPPMFNTYLRRGEGGLLRANASVGNAIVLGYMMMVGIGLFLMLYPKMSRLSGVAVMATLCAGIVAALSRGPWVGAAVAVLVALSLGPGGGKRIAQLIGLGAITFGVLLMTPHGKNILDHLPFIGSVDEGNVVYRQQLFTLSMLVLWQDPVFGAGDYILNPLLEEMRTGLGIIDIVNSYLEIALAYGMVGLASFVAPFLFGLAYAWRARRRAMLEGDIEVERIGRVLIGTIFGILVTIATVSSIGIISTVYWVVLGLCVAYARAFGQEQIKSDTPPGLLVTRLKRDRS
jgi:O-antigen ligase